MFEYEMAQLKIAELHREGDARRRIRDAREAHRETGGQVTVRKGGVARALRSVRPPTAG
jgi:hypothetical protein